MHLAPSCCSTSVTPTQAIAAVKGAFSQQGTTAVRLAGICYAVNRCHEQLVWHAHVQYTKALLT